MKQFNRYLLSTFTAFVIFLNISRCSKTPSDNSDNKNSSTINPVYVTVAGHIEDTQIYTQCLPYKDYRAKLLTLAETLAQTGAAFNLQIEYEFFIGVTRCETDSLKSLTGDMNIIQYLISHYGFEIDPHQEGGTEEGLDNYADVHYLGSTITQDISDIVGGLLWDSADMFARLANGETGWLYPNYTWQPEILTLAVSSDHHSGDFSRDDVASGVWQPKGTGDNFWVHDSAQSMVYIGPGQHTNWGKNDGKLSSVEFIKTLIERIENEEIDDSQMMTATITVPQSVIFNESKHGKLMDILNQIAPYIESGQVKYVTYSETVDIWVTEYKAEPNIFHLTENE